MTKRPSRYWLLLIAAAILAGIFIFDRHATPCGAELVLRKPVNREASAGDLIALIPIFPTRDVPSPVFKGNFWASPQIAKVEGHQPILLVMPSSGSVAALELGSGRRLWETTLPRKQNEEIFLRAAPIQFAGQLMVVYTLTNQRNGEIRHVAVVLDLARGTVDRRYPELAFTANLPATGGKGRVLFDPEFQYPRAISFAPSASGLGHAYVTFGANRDQGAWHGWLFEIDLDTWRSGVIHQAISSVFVTTPEADCDDGTNGKLCGGGLWAYDGAQIHMSARARPEIIVQSGNGRFDLSRQNYSESLIRLEPGLKFAPQCDWKLCAKGDPRAPSEQCLASCRNLFVPRLLATDAPFRTPDGACNDKTYMECLELKDWDFGSSSPHRFEIDGHAYFVTAGKAGDVFLIDGRTLGVMYDRKQAVPLCGTSKNPCLTPNEGLTMTQPELGSADGTPMVVIPTYNTDNSHPAGIVAYRVTGIPEQPRLQEAWRVPARDSREAISWFRAPPTRPIISKVSGTQIVWVADNGHEGRILGVRLRDGALLGNMRTAGWPMRNARPVIYNDILYLPAAVQDREDLTWIEAYRIAPKLQR